MTTNPGPQSGRFSDVDATRQAEQFVTFLEWIEGLPQVMELRKRSYEDRGGPAALSQLRLSHRGG
jgi:hypothetical protein